MNKKIGLVAVLVFFSFIFVTDVSAAFVLVDGDSCSSNGNSVCSSNQKCTCGADIAYVWDCVTCSLGCSDGSCINGTCGTANNTAVDSAPTSGLCNTGSVYWTDQTGDDGIFNWRCTGTDCKAYKNCTCGLANGQTYTGDLPTGSLALCKLGNASTPNFNSSTGAWSWTCDPYSACTVKNYCTAYKKTNGVCGEANGQDYKYGTPPTTGLCSSGTSYWIDISGTDSFYDWECRGITGGTTVSCMALSVDCSKVCSSVCSQSECTTNFFCKWNGSCVYKSCGDYNGVCLMTGVCNSYGGTALSVDYTTVGCSPSHPVCCAGGETCKSKNPFASCETKEHCQDNTEKETFEWGNAIDCTDPNYTCCTKVLVPGCEQYTSLENYSCQTILGFGTCSVCNDGKNFPYGSECNSTVVGKGTDGNCANYTSSDSYCNYAEITSKCDSSFGYTSGVTDPEEGGNFTWTCKGQPASECVTLTGDSKSCSVARKSKADGECGITTDTCNSGNPINIGTTEVVSNGINNVWTCEGICSEVDDSCSSEYCTNKPVVNGQCINVATLEDVANHTLCVIPGQESNVTVTEDKITWSCLGSTNTCAEGDGEDKSCSSEIDQDNWFQVNDGNILAKGQVSNYIPITCNGSGNSCVPSTVVNGGINSRVDYSSSRYDDVSATVDSTLHVGIYPYSELKTSYFSKKGVGTTFASGTDWSTIKEATGILFVDGNLEINSKLVTSNFVMIVAEGTITINPNVEEIDAILVANKVVAAAADASSTDVVSQLVINGMVHGVSKVEFSRSLYPKSGNNTAPSVVVNYRPELLFMVPTELSKQIVRWKVN